MAVCKFVLSACVCASRNGGGFCTDFRSPKKFLLGPSATTYVMQSTGTPQGRLSSLADSLRYTSRLRIGKGRPSKEVCDSRADIFCLPVKALIQFLRDELDREHREFCFDCSYSVFAYVPSKRLIHIKAIWISFRHTHKNMKVQVSYRSGIHIK